MSVWEYRVYKENDCYTLREHHEHSNGHVSCTGPTHPMSFDSENELPIESLRWQLRMMLKALEKPVIEVDRELSG